MLGLSFGAAATYVANLDFGPDSTLGTAKGFGANYGLKDTPHLWGKARYTSEGERVSNITEWGLRQFRERYSDDSISAEDIFAYTYGVLHDPVYREKYSVDLLREFPRLPFYPEFQHWVKMGQELLDLHIGFESAEPYPLQRVEQAGEAKRVILRADKERGVIVLDDVTSLAGVPPDAWRYRLGSRSALEWVLDQHKERKPRDPTIAEKFNTYRFADYKERVIDLLQRVCAVSVGTMDVVDDMAYWDDEGRPGGVRRPGRAGMVDVGAARHGQVRRRRGSGVVGRVVGNLGLSRQGRRGFRLRWSGLG